MLQEAVYRRSHVSQMLQNLRIEPSKAYDYHSLFLQAAACFKIMVPIRVILGLYGGDNGKENGNYYNGL